MTTSLDRKLARCAREIEAAKPKLMSFDDFETLHHAFPDGTFKKSFWENLAEAEPLAKPAARVAVPSKFKVGDRVRYVEGSTLAGEERVVTRVIENFEYGKGNFLTRIEFGEMSWDSADQLELAPSEPQADSEGWIEWKGGECPVPKDAVVRVRCMTPSNERDAGKVDVKASGVCWGSHRVLAYRVIK